MLGVGAAAALAGVGLASRHWQAKPAAAQAVTNFWSLSFDRPDGGVLALSELMGRPLLLNFWATWCPPCVEELPMLDVFWREHASKSVQVLGLAVDQPSAVRRFLARQPLGFPIALAGFEGTELARSLGNQAGGLPFSVFFSADGAISKQKLGQVSPRDLSSWIASLG